MKNLVAPARRPGTSRTTSAVSGGPTSSAAARTWRAGSRGFAAPPMVFAEMSDAELEYPHFATWFGMTYLRTYDDPAVSDLYYLHEIVHAALLHYEPRRRSSPRGTGR